MAKFKKKILLLAVLIIIALSLLFYRQFYYINWERFTVAVGRGGWESPDGYYSIKITLYPTSDVRNLSVEDLYDYLEQTSEDIYVVGRLHWNPTVRGDGVIVWSGENQKVFFYDKYDGSPCTVAWLDNDTVTVNGVVLNLPNQTYDYRRFWQTWR